MFSLHTFLVFAHLIGLVFGAGAATVKLVILFKCKSDHSYVPVFIKIARPVTKLIIMGMILLTLSGIVWLIQGYSFNTNLIVKLILVFALWIIGPIIDNAIEPKFTKLAPAAGQNASQEFVEILNKYFVVEMIATGLFYAVIVIWILY